MNYTIYADVLFLENAFVNLLVLFLAERILGIKLRLWKLLVLSSAGGMINVISYLILYRANALIRLFTFALTGFGMTLALYTGSRKTRLFHIFFAVLFSEFLMAGILTVLTQKPLESPAYLLVTVLAFTLLFFAAGREKEERKNRIYIHRVTVYMEYEKAEFTGFMDSGNLLRIPLSEKGVIIGDRRAMLRIMPQEFQDFTQNYLKTGMIDYAALLNIPSKWMIIPVTYGCINEKSGTMPGIICTRIVIDDGEWEFSDVPICFTRMNLNGGYHMLLPKDLCSEN